MTASGGRVLLCCALLGAAVAAQQQGGLLQGNQSSFKPDQGDYSELRVAGGFLFVWPPLGLEIRGQAGIALYDREQVQELLRPEPPGDLPQRGIAPPAPRRRLTPDVLRARLDSFLAASGTSSRAELTPAELDQRLPRYLYFEGGITVLQHGIEVARASRLWISPLDDRMVVEDAELRYATLGADGQQQLLVVRGNRLQKQGPRWTGRNLTLTSCEAGEPHVAVLAGEVEIIERPGQFEVIGRDNWLRFSGTDVVPLPDAHFFTGEQSAIPLKGAAAGYDSKEGMRARLDFGLDWNDLGGSLHELFGGDAADFRGEWLLSPGWIEQRGLPLQGSIAYRARDRYEGRTEAFWLRDHGDDIREITSNLDGSAIDVDDRALLRTRNRIHVGERSHLDLTAFHASDAAVYSEFFGGDYRDSELPETSAYFAHAADNLLFTIDGRFDLDDFAFRDNRALAPGFVEELPVATLDLIAQPIADLGGTPLVLDASTELGQRRINPSAGATAVFPERTLRGHQQAELSAPFHLGVFDVRPYLQASFTAWDHDALGDGASRWGHGGGVQIATRLSRSWSWRDADGNLQGVRHVIAPQLVYDNVLHVDDEPAAFRQFDAIDALDERERVRFGARNLLQRMRPGPGGAQPYDFLFVDLMQNVHPNAARDNAGDTWGLLEYELLVRPYAYWLPFSTFAFGAEGEHDWRHGLRTFNTELRVGRIAGLDWIGGYRTDSMVDGAVNVGAAAQLFDRWQLSANSQYDLDRDDWTTWSFNLDRIDHDWTIRAGVAYDPFTDVVTFRLTFEPRLPGLLHTPDRSSFAGQRYDAGGTMMDF